jgi:hypothetical protein
MDEAFMARIPANDAGGLPARPALTPQRSRQGLPKAAQSSTRFAAQSLDGENGVIPSQSQASPISASHHSFGVGMRKAA